MFICHEIAQDIDWDASLYDSISLIAKDKRKRVNMQWLNQALFRVRTHGCA